MLSPDCTIIPVVIAAVHFAVGVGMGLGIGVEVGVCVTLPTKIKMRDQGVGWNGECESKPLLSPRPMLDSPAELIPAACDSVTRVIPRKVRQAAVGEAPPSSA
jgi:hypothetical protein